METKIDIKKTALLIIDMQNDLIKAKEEPFNGVTKMSESKKAISNTARVIAAARQVAMPVIFCGHVCRKDGADIVPTITDEMLQGLAPPPRERMVEGTSGADFVDELKPQPGDYVVSKRRGNAFYNTELELLLRSRGVDTLICCGAVTNGCVLATVIGARERDFHTIILSDCCVAMTKAVHDWPMENIFPRSGRVRTSDEMVTVLSGASV